jgi:hypothetical protein
VCARFDRRLQGVLRLGAILERLPPSSLLRPMVRATIKGGEEEERIQWHQHQPWSGIGISCQRRQPVSQVGAHRLDTCIVGSRTYVSVLAVGKNPAYLGHADPGWTGQLAQHSRSGLSLPRKRDLERRYGALCRTYSLIVPLPACQAKGVKLNNRDPTDQSVAMF